MSDPNQSSENLQDQALLDAWRTLMYFDQLSMKGRKDFKNLRRWIILITFMISVFSVFTLMFSFAQWFVLILPIVGLNLMNYTTLYSKPTTWIEHRYAAEKVRSEIYLYRANVGKYHLPPNQKDDILQDEVSKVLEDAPHGMSDEGFIDKETFDKNPMEEIQKALEWSKDDNGFTDLSDDAGMKQYIKTRVQGQMEWYQTTVKKDYKEGKRMTQVAIVITTIGSILGLLLGANEPHWVGLFAIVNSISVALVAFSNVNMSGRTYRLYYETLVKLKRRLGKWNAILNNDDMKDSTFKEQARSKFVTDIETILMDELDRWYEIATEIQISNDTSLRNSFSKQVDSE